jgi:hypothetical protein
MRSRDCAPADRFLFGRGRVYTDVSVELDDVAREVIEGPHLAMIATSNADGRPQSSVIFVKPNPFVDGHAAAAAAMRSAGRLRAYRLAWRAVHAHRGRDPLRVALAGPPGSLAMMTTPDAVAGFEAILPEPVSTTGAKSP